MSSLNNMFNFNNICAILLFMLESFHAMSHLNVMLGIRLLPRKDLVRLRLYFLIDSVTVICSSILFLRQLQWLAVIQVIQHLYYVIFWEKHKLTKKIVSWSSIDWIKSSFHEKWHFDSILGLLFDVLTHLIMALLLCQHMTTVQILVSLVVVTLLLVFVLWNPKFAWSNPRSPARWVQKRIQAIPTE